MTEPSITPIRPRGGRRHDDYVADRKAAWLAEQAAKRAAYTPGPRTWDDGEQVLPFRPLYPSTATPSEAFKPTGFKRPELDEQAERVSLRDLLAVARAVEQLTGNDLGATFTAAELKDYAEGTGYHGSLADPMTRLALEGVLAYSGQGRGKPVLWTLVEFVDLDAIRDSRP